MQPADIHTNEEKITDDSFKMLQDGLRLCRFPKGLRGGPLRDAEHVSQSQLDQGHGREEHFIAPQSRVGGRQPAAEATPQGCCQHGLVNASIRNLKDEANFEIGKTDECSRKCHEIVIVHAAKPASCGMKSGDFEELATSINTIHNPKDEEAADTKMRNECEAQLCSTIGNVGRKIQSIKCEKSKDIPAAQ